MTLHLALTRYMPRHRCRWCGGTDTSLGEHWVEDPDHPGEWFHGICWNEYLTEEEDPYDEDDEEEDEY
jgi:hypothetical protein